MTESDQLHPPISASLDTLNEACEQYKASKVYALFSGGDDSLASLRVAIEHPKFVAAVHCNTGIGVEATREFARETCKSLGCPLLEYCAKDNVQANGKPDPQIYEEMVMTHGFPGPTKFGHGKMYVRLKERGIARMMREEAAGETIVLASGCRITESVRRMGTTKRIQQGEIGRDGRHRHKRRIWVNHIHDWTSSDTHHFRIAKGLKRNPVSELICKSGECLCGGFGNEGELEELCMFDLTRDVGRYLLDLQKRVLAAGFPWRWHERPPEWYLASKRGQRMLFEMNKYDVGVMCQGCEAKAAERGACNTEN